jgi:biotin transport system substrate-specific component
MNSTLVGRLWPRTVDSTLMQVVLVIAGTALLALSAKVQVPFWPVPMTMQTFVVLIIGAAYGARLGGITLLAYLAEGAIGLPVFAKGGGVAYLAGPTGGYLVGFLVAAFVVGWLADRGYGRAVLTTLVAFVIGEAVIFTLGVGWLATIIGLDKAVAAGLVPFLPAEALKIALACALLPLAWQAKPRDA